MAWNLVSSTTADSTGTGNLVSVTSSAIDTTGATLLVMSYAYLGNGGTTVVTISDNKSNTWTINLSNPGGLVGVQNGIGLAYVLTPTVGTGHTFSCTGTTTVFPVLTLQAWSQTGPSFDQQKSGHDSTQTTWKPSFITTTDVITPSANGALVIEAWKISTTAIVGAISVNTGYTIVGAAVSWNLTTAYRVQTTATGDDPTFSWSGTLAGTFEDQVIAFLGFPSTFPALTVAL